jgi:hypothetical protein
MKMEYVVVDLPCTYMIWKWKATINTMENPLYIYIITPAETLDSKICWYQSSEPRETRLRDTTGAQGGSGSHQGC